MAPKIDDKQNGNDDSHTSYDRGKPLRASRLIVETIRIKMATESSSSDLQRQETSSSKDATTHGAADMTRRMVCGGLAGMIAKVRYC